MGWLDLAGLSIRADDEYEAIREAREKANS